MFYIYLVIKNKFDRGSVWSIVSNTYIYVLSVLDINNKNNLKNNYRKVCRLK